MTNKSGASMDTVNCDCCSVMASAKASKKGVRLPTGWKRHNERVWCNKCWRAAFKLRAVTFPVAGIIDGEWPELRAALRGAWGRSTALANWAVRELAKADCVRSASAKKLEKMPAVNLYRLWQEHWQRDEWDGAAICAGSVLRHADAKYRKARYKIVWTGEQSLPSFRYPYPYPVHNSAWEASYQEHTGTDGHISCVPVVSVPIGGRRWTLRLKGGSEHIRQLRSFAKIVSGEAVQGELAIYRQGTFANGNGVTETNGTAGSERRTRIILKLVAWLPRTGDEGKQEGTLSVMTTNNSFLVALMPDDEQPWRLHADDIRGVIKQHAKLRQRLADDTKAEQRRPPRQKARYLTMLDSRCNRCNNRVDTFIKEAASWLVRYAQRRRAECMTYDDTKRGYFPSFPWAAFKSQVEQKCDDAGIAFVASGDMVSDDESSESVEA